MEQTTTEPAAFEDVYREQRLSLIRLAYLLTGSREQAEDIVQSAFAAAHDRWPEVANPPAYLRRAVVNLAFPLALIKSGLDIAGQFVPEYLPKVDAIRESVTAGFRGPLVDVDDGGQRVEIIAE